jgi:hypothetical protein
MIDVALQLDIFALWDSFVVTTVLMIGVAAGFALVSRSLAVASYVGFLVFARIALESQYALFINFLYISVIVIVVGMAFKFGRLELGFMGES